MNLPLSEHFQMKQDLLEKNISKKHPGEREGGREGGREGERERDMDKDRPCSLITIRGYHIYTHTYMTHIFSNVCHVILLERSESSNRMIYRHGTNIEF